MNAATTERTAGFPPLLRARTAGGLYLLSIVTGVFAEKFASGNLSLALNLIGTTSYVAVTLLLYDLLKPVNKGLSLLAALCSLTGCAVTYSSLLHLPSLGVDSLVFFGFYCLLLAYLIFRSTFLPRFLSALLTITGLGWLTYLSPALGHRLFPYLMFTGLAGEGSLTLWLLAMGVNSARWEEAADRVHRYSR